MRVRDGATRIDEAVSGEIRGAPPAAIVTQPVVFAITQARCRIPWRCLPRRAIE